LQVIKKLSDINFYFIGEIYLNKYYVESEDRVRLQKWEDILQYKNVHYLGEFPESILQSILPFFKVGIIPYKTNDLFNEYSNPIKLYDYSEGGMFVISPPLLNITTFTKDFPIILAETPTEYMRGISRALALPQKEILKYEIKVQKFFKEQSIEIKSTKVMQRIKKLLT